MTKPNRPSRARRVRRPAVTATAILLMMAASFQAVSSGAQEKGTTGSGWGKGWVCVSRPLEQGRGNVRVCTPVSRIASKQ
jgi:hypothetical protein